MLYNNASLNLLLLMIVSFFPKIITIIVGIVEIKDFIRQIIKISLLSPKMIFWTIIVTIMIEI